MFYCLISEIKLLEYTNFIVDCSVNPIAEACGRKCLQLKILIKVFLIITHSLEIQIKSIYDGNFKAKVNATKCFNERIRWSTTQ